MVSLWPRFKFFCFLGLGIVKISFAFVLAFAPGRHPMRSEAPSGADEG
jgi:hypothetical protein